MSELQAEEPMTANVVIEIRNDKDRGNLILTIRREDEDNVYFFKYHHQAVHHHPEQIQQIVASSKPTTRTKSIKVNILGFMRQYWNGSFFEFKGVELNSAGKQSTKVYNRLLNKEVGKIKRKQTIEESKQIKLQQKNDKIRQKILDDEAAFQIERAKRITELMKRN